jgi:CHAT domain-containing protein/Tfp pilus assembly protein PilF
MSPTLPPRFLVLASLLALAAACTPAAVVRAQSSLPLARTPATGQPQPAPTTAPTTAPTPAPVPAPALELAPAAQQAEPPASLDTVRSLIKAGRYADAEAIARQLLQQAEADQGPQSLPVARALDLLSEALWRAGKAADSGARTMAERAVRIKEQTLGQGDPELARSLTNLGGLLRQLGEYPAARQAYERAVQIQESALGPQHLDLATTLNALSILTRDMGEYAAARQLTERALQIRVRALGPNHPDVAASLNSLGSVLVEAHEHQAARTAYERALAIRLQALGPDHPLVAVTHTGLGRVLFELGDYAQAIDHFQRAIEIREKALGPSNPDLAATLSNLAAMLWIAGDYARARPLYERALAIQEKALGPEHPGVTLTLHNYGSLLRSMGDYATARATLERGLEIEQRTLGAAHRQVGESLANLADLLLDMGARDEARPLLTRAVQVLEAAVGQDDPRLARALGSMARLEREDGALAAARPLLERSLRIQQRALGGSHPDVANTLRQLADVERASNDLAAARRDYERALAIQEITLGANHPALGSTLDGCALALAGAGEFDTAIAVALRADQIGRDHLRLTVRTLAEREALRYAAVRGCGLDLALSLCSSGRAVAASPSVLDALIRSRALVLDEMASRHRTVAATGAADVVQLAEDLAGARQRLANLAVRDLSTQDPTSYRKLLDLARAEEERAEHALAQRSATFRQRLEQDQVGLPEIMAALPAGSALVSYARYQRQTLDGGPAVPAYAAIVLRADERQPQIVPLSDAATVEGLVQRWRDEIARGVASQGAAAASLEAGCRRAGAQLRAAIWDPMAPLLEGVAQVFAVPDGALNLVSLAALPTPDDSSQRYLVDSGPLLHYLSAERDLARADAGAVSGKGLLAVGGPEFDSARPFAGRVTVAQRLGAQVATGITAAVYRGPTSSCGDFASLRFVPLAASARETKEVAGLWKKGAGAGAPGTDDRREVLRLTGSEATEAAFKREAPGRRMLHLATHSFFLGGEACGSAIATEGSATGERGPTSAPGPATIRENPLLRAGLALAGANRRALAGPDEEDGVLTAEEIAALDLSGVEWAVLSACATGVGEVVQGEGVLGLCRAFRVAGAGTLIMSLWAVEDEATRAWMDALYAARLQDRLGTAQAVRSASLAILRERRAHGESTHPFYWGGFVAAGNWR